jgi:hypothetical protein
MAPARRPGVPPWSGTGERVASHESIGRESRHALSFGRQGRAGGCFLALLLGAALAPGLAAERVVGEEEPAPPPALLPAAAGDPEAAAAGEEDAAVASDAVASGDEAPRRPNPCRISARDEEEWLDELRREIFEEVCDGARRFDALFGNRRFDEEARRTNGRVQARLVWDEVEGAELDGRFRINVDFPNLDHRVRAFAGRDEPEEFLTGTDAGFDFLPDFFRQRGSEEWLVGLGYRPASGDRRSTDVDVGVEVETPLEPFVRGRYRQFWVIGDRNLLRVQESLYWRNQRGFGSATRVDLERPVGRQALLRWASLAVYDEVTLGVDWESGVTLFQGFGPHRAVALYVGADGETEAPVGLHELGTRATYRQRMLRDWFFGELIGGVTWPQELPGEGRSPAWHLGVGFEIQFSGEELGAGWPGRRSAPPPPEG